MITLIDLAAKLERRKLSSRQLVEHCLANIDNRDGEGHRAFLSVYRERALAEANAADQARADGRHGSPFCGIPLSIKDLFDVAGEVTRAGSHALDEHAAAKRDAVQIRHRSPSRPTSCSSQPVSLALTTGTRPCNCSRREPS